MPFIIQPACTRSRINKIFVLIIYESYADHTSWYISCIIYRRGFLPQLPIDHKKKDILELIDACLYDEANHINVKVTCDNLPGCINHRAPEQCLSDDSWEIKGYLYSWMNYRLVAVVGNSQV